MAAGQKPMPEVRVACMYPRNIKFLEDARQEKRNCVEDSVLEGVVSAHAHRAESKAVQRRDGQQQQREHRESVEDALPESLAQNYFNGSP